MPLDARSAAVPGPIPTSARWLDLDWRRHLPWRIGHVDVVHGTADHALAFIGAHYGALFDTAADEDRWLREPMTAAKRRFLDDADVFVFRDGDRTVGIQIAQPTDWSTYYLRSTALLPAYQAHDLATDLCLRMMAPLRDAGVTRLECETAPTNTACMRAVIRLGFVPTATHNTDRWGTLVRFTRYLDDSADEIFRAQYCAGTWPRCRPPESPGAERSP